MIKSDGFTLLELIVVLVVISLMVLVAVPTYMNMSEQGRAQTAQSNLLAIQTAQVKYNEDHASYCLAGCGDTTAGLNTNLHVAISDTFTYSCAAAGGNIPYNCTATDNVDTLTLDPNASPMISCVPGGCGL